MNPQIIFDQKLLPLAQCDQCKLSRNGCPVTPVRYDGPLSSPYVFLTEAPAKTEVDQGLPLIGVSGKLFNMILQQAGLHRGDVFVDNALACKLPNPSGGNKREVWANEIASCLPRLNGSLDMLPNKRIIVAMGNWAAYAVTGDERRTVGKSHGLLLWSKRHSCYVLITYHPSAVLRKRDFYLDVLWTFKKARQIVESGRADNHFPTRIWTPEYGGEVHLNNMVPQTTDEAIDLMNRVPVGDKSCPLHISSDVETSAFEYYNPSERILCTGFYWGQGTDTFVLPGELMMEPSVHERLCQLYSDPGAFWIWHNGKYDEKWMKAKGIPAPVHADTLVMHYALDERKGTHDLDRNSRMYAEAEPYSEKLSEYLPSKDCSYSVIPPNILYEYQAKDVYYDYLVYQELERELLLPENRIVTPGYPQHTDLIENILIPGSRLWADIEMDGIRVDTGANEKLDTRYLNQIEEIAEECRVMAGVPTLNLNSPKQLAVVLYDNLGLPMKGPKRTTDKKFLEANADVPFVQKLMEHRTLAKLHGTYVKGIRVRMFEGRVYPSKLVHGTVTGRYATRNPNFDNQPRGSIVKLQYIPDEGYVWVQGDYSNLEVRTSAWYSEDPVLIEALKGDIHWNVALAVFPDIIDEIREARSVDELGRIAGKHSILTEIAMKHTLNPFSDPEIMQKTLLKHVRHMTKYITFGILYGRGAKSLAEGELQCSRGEAQFYINQFFKRFPQLKKWIDVTKWEAVKRGWVETPSGRKRRFPIQTNPWEQFEDERMGVNMKAQAMASDICQMAAYDVHWELKKKDLGRVLTTVHDSVITQIRREQLVRGLRIQRQLMEDVSFDSPVEFPVDIEIGHNWYQMVEVTDLSVDGVEDALRRMDELKKTTDPFKEAA